MCAYGVNESPEAHFGRCVHAGPDSFSLSVKKYINSRFPYLNLNIVSNTKLLCNAPIDLNLVRTNLIRILSPFTCNVDFVGGRIEVVFSENLFPVRTLIPCHQAPVSAVSPYSNLPSRDEDLVTLNRIFKGILSPNQISVEMFLDPKTTSKLHHRLMTLKKAMAFSRLYRVCMAISIIKKKVPNFVRYFQKLSYFSLISQATFSDGIESLASLRDASVGLGSVKRLFRPRRVLSSISLDSDDDEPQVHSPGLFSVSRFLSPILSSVDASRNVSFESTDHAETITMISKFKQNLKVLHKCTSNCSVCQNSEKLYHTAYLDRPTLDHTLFKSLCFERASVPDASIPDVVLQTTQDVRYVWFVSMKNLNALAHATNGNIVSPIVLKYVLFYISVYAGYFSDPKNEIDIVFSELSSINHAHTRTSVRIEGPSIIVKGQIFRNSTHNSLWVQLPLLHSACETFQLLAPTMECSEDQTYFLVSDFLAHRNYSHIERGFFLSHFDPYETSTLVAFQYNNHYDWDYLQQIFPSWASYLSAPVVVRNDFVRPRSAAFNTATFVVESAIGAITIWGFRFARELTIQRYANIMERVRSAMGGTYSYRRLDADHDSDDEGPPGPKALCAVDCEVDEEKRAMGDLLDQVVTLNIRKDLDNLVLARDFYDAFERARSQLQEAASPLVEEGVVSVMPPASQTPSLYRSAYHLGQIRRRRGITAPQPLVYEGEGPFESIELREIDLPSASTSRTRALPAVGAREVEELIRGAINVIRSPAGSYSSLDTTVHPYTFPPPAQPKHRDELRKRRALYFRKTRQNDEDDDLPPSGNVLMQGVKVDVGDCTKGMCSASCDCLNMDSAVRYACEMNDPALEFIAQMSLSKGIPNSIRDALIASGQLDLVQAKIKRKEAGEVPESGETCELSLEDKLIIQNHFVNAHTYYIQTVQTSVPSVSNLDIQTTRIYRSDKDHRVLYGGGRVRSDLRRRRSVSRVVTSGLRFVSKIPSWGWASVFTVGNMLLSAYHNWPSDADYIPKFPILHYSELERFFNINLALILNGCYIAAPDQVRSKHDGLNPEMVLIGTKSFRPSDVVFDFNNMRAGPLLHHCHPMFQSQFIGLPRNVLKRSILFMFDGTYFRDGVLYYNGPPYFIVSDYPHYYETVFKYYNVIDTAFPVTKITNIKKLYKISTPYVTPEALYSSRRRRSPSGRFTVSNGTSYIEVAHRVQYPFFVPMAHPRLIRDINHIYSSPSFRYEFDLAQAITYNDSQSYYMTLKHAADSWRLLHHRNDVFSLFDESMSPADVLRAMDPFMCQSPRMCLLREIVDGFETEKSMLLISQTLLQYKIQVANSNLTSLIAAAFSSSYSNSPLHFRQIASLKLTSSQFEHVLSQVYDKRYLRIPLLFIYVPSFNISSIKSKINVTPRDTTFPSSWNYYSPLVLSHSFELVDSSVYSICFLPRSEYASINNIDILLSRNSLLVQQAYVKGCRLASERVFYDDHPFENLYLYNVPNIIYSFINFGENVDVSGRGDPAITHFYNSTRSSSGRGSLPNPRFDLHVSSHNNRPEMYNYKIVPFLSGVCVCGLLCVLIYAWRVRMSNRAYLGVNVNEVVS